MREISEISELINDIRAAEAEIEHGEEITQDEFETELKEEGWIVA